MALGILEFSEKQFDEMHIRELCRIIFYDEVENREHSIEKFFPKFYEDYFDCELFKYNIFHVLESFLIHRSEPRNFQRRLQEFAHYVCKNYPELLI